MTLLIRHICPMHHRSVSSSQTRGWTAGGNVPKVPDGADSGPASRQFILSKGLLGEEFSIGAAALLLGLALIAAGLAAPPALNAAAAPAAQRDPSVVAQMRSTASGDLAVRENPATGKVGFARVKGADPDLLPGVAAEGRQGAIDKATRYLVPVRQRVRRAPGRADPDRGLRRPRRLVGHLHPGLQGRAGLRRRDQGRGQQEGALTSVNGFAAPNLSLSTTPRVSKADASARALAMVRLRSGRLQGRRSAPKGYQHGLKVRSIELMIYRTGSTARHRRPRQAGLGRRGVEQGHHPRDGHPRRGDQQAAQPLDDDDRRARPLAGRGTPGRQLHLDVDARATRSPTVSTRTSRTRSSAPARRTGCSATPSATTPGTAPAVR